MQGHHALGVGAEGALRFRGGGADVNHAANGFGLLQGDGNIVPPLLQEIVGLALERLLDVLQGNVALTVRVHHLQDVVNARGIHVHHRQQVAHLLWLQHPRVVRVQHRECVQQRRLLLLCENQALVLSALQRRRVRHPLHHHHHVLQPAVLARPPPGLVVVLRQQHVVGEVQLGLRLTPRALPLNLPLRKGVHAVGVEVGAVGEGLQREGDVRFVVAAVVHRSKL
mmetsp:Transcript_11055/g.20833  ORF Transcript_11055/g.20833 Transcript_11055/m.20833 type:complete len:225 (-) Transcript_11055:2801-3475(-)